MAVPKQKSPRSRRNHRRGHQKLKGRQTQTCPKCNEEKLPHRVCKHCGYYKNMEVLETED